MVAGRSRVGESRSKTLRTVVFSKGRRIVVAFGISVVGIELPLGKLVTWRCLNSCTSTHANCTHQGDILHLTIGRSHRLTGLNTPHFADKAAHSIGISISTACCKSIGICTKHTHTGILEALVESFHAGSHSFSGLIVDHFLELGSQFFSQLLGRFFFFLAGGKHAERQQGARGDEEKTFHGGNKIIYVPEISRICDACQGKE